MAGCELPTADTARWEPLPPLAVLEVLTAAAVPWWMAGGHGLDLFAGRSWRDHADIDVLVLRPDVHRLAAHLRGRGFEVWTADPPGRVRHWPAGEALPREVHDLWVRRQRHEPWVLQIMVDECDGDTWVSRRDPAVRRSIADLGGKTTAGIPFLDPTVTLFYKAKTPRPKDELDFSEVLPVLDATARSWLAATIREARPDHPWLARLVAEAAGSHRAAALRRDPGGGEHGRTDSTLHRQVAPLTPASTTVGEHVQPPLAAHRGPLPTIIAAAERAVSDSEAPIEVQLLGRLLLHHRPATAQEYSRDVRAFAGWCWTARGIGILAADRTTVELWLHTLQAEGIRARTLRRRLSAVQSYFLEAVDAGVIERVPTLRVKRPRVSEPTRLGISREEASLLLEAAENAGARDEALVRLLLLNGLRASEAAALRIGDVGRERGHRTVTVHRKGNITTVEAVSPHTSDALDRLLKERKDRGAAEEPDPLFVSRIEKRVDGKCVVEDGEPLSRHGVARVVRRLGQVAGTAGPLNPHELRHAFITLGLDAGATLRDLQRAAAHSDPRTTADYDRRRTALDSHPSYLVERYLA